MRKYKRNNLKTFLLFFLFMVALSFTACKDGGSVKDVVDGAMKALVDQDYKAFVNSFIMLDDKEYLEKIIELQFRENPLVDYVISKEEDHGENTAVIEVKFKQKDGKETTVKIVMVKNKNGEWKIEDVKDGKDNTPATEEIIEEEIVEETSGESKEDSNNTYTVNGESFTMVAVEGGTFTMGLTPEQDYGANDSEPVHDVALSDFYIGQTEVTQALWVAVMGYNPNERVTSTASHIGDNLPVSLVSWDDCQTFISKLNAMTEGQRPNGREFRMPTEAEWEFAARGGNNSNHTQFAGSSIITSVAWFDDNSNLRPRPVATKLPNELGIYDMSGNVSEWCQDWYAPDYYSRSPSTNPCNNTTSSNRYGRVTRGGSNGGGRIRCSVAARSNGPEFYSGTIGFRLAL